VVRSYGPIKGFDPPIITGKLGLVLGLVLGLELISDDISSFSVIFKSNLIVTLN
jgi:hypothetical protein